MNKNSFEENLEEITDHINPVEKFFTGPTLDFSELNIEQKSSAILKDLKDY
jgi:hypothetical protein